MSYNQQTYIVELSSRQVRAMAKLIHFGLAHDEGNKDLSSVLDSLIVQASGIHREPEKHGVYKDPLMAPGNVKRLGDAWVSPVV